MQVKILKNLLHKGVTHTVGALIELDDHLVPHLEKNGIVSPNVTQNPAELHDKVVETSQQPATNQAATTAQTENKPVDPEKQAEKDATKVQDEELDIKQGENVPQIEKEEDELDEEK